jgi:hypothetical protein
MDLKSLSPEFFNALILASIGLSLVLAGWRFYREMKRTPRPENEDQLYLADMRRFYEQASSKQDTPRS